MSESLAKFTRTFQVSDLRCKTHPRCKTCRHLQDDDVVKSTGSDYVHHIKSSFTCTSSNVIYMIECSYCHKQYIGETGQPVNVRINGHHVDTAKKLPKEVAQHFNVAGHNFDDLKLYILQSNFRSPRDTKYTVTTYPLV